jgi:hypothetical protein
VGLMHPAPQSDLQSQETGHDSRKTPLIDLWGDIMSDHRTPSEKLYDEFDHLIDKCQTLGSRKFAATAEELRKLRDALPD